MRIGIDARFYSQAGVGRYTRNLITELQRIDKKNEYFIFLMKDDLLKFEGSANFHKVQANYSWYGFEEQVKMPALLNKFKLDLVHFPHFNIPIFYKGKFVVTIHDLIHQHFNMQRATTRGPLIFQGKRFVLKQILKMAVNNSQKVITVSDYVKDCLIREVKAKRDQIVVTKEAVDESLLKITSKISDKDIKNILDKFGIKPPFVFYIGNAHPHKNVEGLIQAFKKLRKNYQYLTLVLSGNDHYFWKRIKFENKDNKNIIFTGYVTEEELVALYKSAKVYVTPSLEEGFGIPTLEAFACKCAVVSSNRASLPEVGGDACLYFDPTNSDDMAEKIALVLNQENLRKELISKGEKRVKEFSWKKMAEETYQIYLKALKLSN